MSPRMVLRRLRKHLMAGKSMFLQLFDSSRIYEGFPCRSMHHATEYDARTRAHRVFDNEQYLSTTNELKAAKRPSTQTSYGASLVKWQVLFAIALHDAMRLHCIMHFHFVDTCCRISGQMQSRPPSIRFKMRP